MVRAFALHWKLLLFAVVVALAGAALVTACTSPTDRDPANGPSTTDESPGIYDAGDGKSRIVGVVVRRDLEGGFWAVADTDNADDANLAANLAVLLPAEGEGVADVELAEAEGRLVAATGILSDGPSIYMAGPLLEVERIQVLEGTESQY